MTAQDNEGGSFEPEGFSERFLDYRELSVKKDCVFRLFSKVALSIFSIFT